MHGIIEITFNNQETHKSSIGKFQSPSQTIGSIIRGYKIATIKKIKNIILSNSDTGELQFAPSEFASTRFENSTGELRFAPSEFAQKKIIALNYKIWQRNYHDHIIRDEQAYINISNYIRNNPKNRKKK
jgi:hypothetical protein